MIETVLGIVKEELESIGVPYEFMQWTSTVNGRYWVGDFAEAPTDTEDGHKDITLMLTGTTQSNWASLMQDRAKIEDHFPTEDGFRKSTEKGAVVIFYANALPVPTGEANLKRIQINLQIQAWKGMK